MSCRTTKIDDPTKKEPTITPVVVKCQEQDCAVWDNITKTCGIANVVSPRQNEKR